MPPPQIFVSTRSRREYSRRRPSAFILPITILLVAFVVLVWTLAAFMLSWGGL